MRDSSGGAVLCGPCALAGLYTCLLWHLQGLGEAGSSTSSSSGGASASSTPPATVERDPACMWTPPPDAAVDAVDAAAGDVGKAAELSWINIPHKSCASMFTTATALWQLLQQVGEGPRDPLEVAQTAATALTRRLTKRGRRSER